MENRLLLRNAINYDEDVAISNVSLTGIKENSILNSINTFHVTQNFAVDIMHDIFEGVCHYDICHIIVKLIDMQYFSLNILNDRKLMFNYGDIEIDHISPAITQSNLANFHLKMTAREMMTFIHLFPLMIGDFVPKDDEVWLFLLNLLEIIDTLLSYEIPRDLAERLQFLIKRHHSQYTHLFNDTLKPKHHLMVHYYNVILKSGPPRNYWCFRFEAKHKEFKSYARAITSRKNICVSFAKKFQLKFANDLVQPKIKSIFQIQNCHRITSAHVDIIKTYCLQNILSLQTDSYSECVYKSKLIKNGYFVCQYNDIDIINAVILKIVEIVVISGQNQPYAVCNYVKVNNFNSHFAAYDITGNNKFEQNKLSIFKISSLAGPPVNSHITARGLQMIRPKQY